MDNTNNNTGANANTSAGDGKNTGAGAMGADTQAATTGAGAGAGAIAGATQQQTASNNAGASNDGKTAGAAGSGAQSEEEIQARINETVKNRLAEEKARAEKKAKEEQAAADGKYQELLKIRDDELAEARSELKAARLRNVVGEQAHAVGITNIAVLMKLIKDDVEYDQDGVPQNVEKLVKAALKDVPGLAGNAAAQSAQGQGQQGQQGTTRVELGATNPQKGGQGVQGQVSLTTPGLFKT